MALTTAGALKTLIESFELSVAAYRDRAPKEATLPYVTVDEALSIVPEAHGDVADASAHHGVSEDVTVHLWEHWRDARGRSAEDVVLQRELRRKLNTAQPFEYADGVRVYGTRVVSSARLVEDEENIVHTALTVRLRRDA